MPHDDKGVVAFFKDHPVLNPSKTATAGRPIFDDLEVCELRFAGSRNVFVFPATSMSHWEDTADGQIKITYAERFAPQYRQFKQKLTQTKAGTPLDYLLTITEARRAELRALNIYTVEALAGIDGTELKNLGPGGRDMKNAAMEYLGATGGSEARVMKLQADLEALMAKNAVLEQDIITLRDGAQTPPPPPPEPEPTNGDPYAGMSDDQLREHVSTLTGAAVRGNLPRRTLMRMADNYRPSAGVT